MELLGRVKIPAEPVDAIDAARKADIPGTVYLTEAEYDALVLADNIVPGTRYIITDVGGDPSGGGGGGSGAAWLPINESEINGSFSK